MRAFGVPAPLLPRLSEPDDRDALRVGDETLSHRALAAACAAHLTRLRDHGIERGDRVGVWTHASMSTAVALAAHAAGGLVSVPLNPKLGRTELTHILEDAAPRAVVAADPSAVADSTPGALEARVETGGSESVEALPADDSPLLVLYTSGTTGPPKGAVLTRANAAFDLDGLADAWGWTALDTVVHALPLFHVHGLVLGLFGALRVGGALDWITRFEPEAVAASVERAPSSLLFAESARR